MALQLITGRAITGKTGVLHRAVIQAAQANRSAIVLVPSFGDVRRTRAELADRVPLGIDVQTLDRCAERLWVLHGDGRRIAGEAARRALVREVVEKHATNPMENSRGYQELIASLASRSAGMILPDEASAGQHGVLRCLEEYRRTCANAGLIERGEVLHRFGERPPLASAVVAVNRFTDLSPAQLEFVRGLAQANDVYIALNWDDASPATEATAQLVTAFLDAGAAHQHQTAEEPAAELAHFERRLFHPVDPLRPTGAVSFLTAAGEEAECAVIARAVRREIVEGVPPREIAITFRDVARRAFLLRAALAAERVDCEIDMVVRFEMTALGRALTALFAGIGGVGGREALMSFLLSPYSAAAPADVERLDAWIRRNRVEKATALLKRARDLGDRTAAALDAATALWTLELDERGAEAWKRLMDVLVENGLLRQERPEVELKLDGSMHTLVVDAATELAALQCGHRNLARSLMDHIAGSQVHSGGQERDGAVYVTEAHRLRSRRFSTLIIGGLTADEFSSEKREPLAVRVLGKLGLPTGTDERLSERLLFYSVATRARRRLVLARQTSTATGGEIRASAFWDEVGDLYRTADAVRAGEDAPVTADSLPLAELETAAPAFTANRRDVRRRVGDGEVIAAESIRGAVAVNAWKDESREFSVTELETYHSCPYRWFYDRMVRPKELDVAFEARERGALIHAVLAEFYRRHTRQLAKRVTPEGLTASLELLESVWRDEAPRFGGTTRGLVEELSFRRSREWARETVTQDALLFDGFDPVGQEWRFGEQDGRPFTLGSARLKGSVDRLDAGGQLLLVTDYKSSSAVPGHRSWQGSGHFQVAVYAEAARTHMGGRVAGGFYRSLPSGDLRGFWNADLADPEGWVARNDRMSDGEYDEMIGNVTAAIEAAVKGICSADIAPRPRDGKSCLWCGAKPFCREART